MSTCYTLVCLTHYKADRGTLSNHKCNNVYVTTSMVGRGQNLYEDKINAWDSNQHLETKVIKKSGTF